MKYIGKIAGIVLWSCSAIVNAAFNGISDHSRANCVNNESITWDYRKSHMLAVVSFHTEHYQWPGENTSHRIEDPWRDTKRSAAVHWGEGDNFFLRKGYLLPKD